MAFVHQSSIVSGPATSEGVTQNNLAATAGQLRNIDSPVTRTHIQQKKVYNFMSNPRPNLASFCKLLKSISV